MARRPPWWGERISKKKCRAALDLYCPVISKDEKTKVNQAVQKLFGEKIRTSLDKKKIGTHH